MEKKICFSLQLANIAFTALRLHMELIGILVDWLGLKVLGEMKTNYTTHNEDSGLFNLPETQDRTD